MTRATGEGMPLQRAAVVLLTVLGALVLGGLTIVAPGFAVVGAGVALVTAVAVAGAGPLLLLVFPGVFIARRIGPGSLNMSGADVTLLVSAAVALPFVAWHNVHVRRVVWAMAGYQVILLVTVLASPGQRALLEWAHRATFLFGALAVGAAVGRLGQVRQALRMLLAGAVVVSAVAVLQAFKSGFAPSFPLGLQKNYAGALVAMTLLVLFVAPQEFGFAHRATLALRGHLFAGVLATQSRGALAGLLVALAIWSVIIEGRAIRAVVLFPAAAVVVLAILLSVRADNEPGKGSDFTPVNARRISYDAALKEWHREPIVGVGLRYYKAEGYRFDLPSYRTTYIEPHSVWYSTLAESGVVGLVALAGLVGFSLRAMRHAAGPLAIAAALLLIAKLVHGMVDIYWVAGTQTLPWLLVGIAAATSRREMPAAAPGTAAAVGPNALAAVGH